MLGILSNNVREPNPRVIPLHGTIRIKVDQSQHRILVLELNLKTIEAIPYYSDYLDAMIARDKNAGIDQEPWGRQSYLDLIDRKAHPPAPSSGSIKGKLIGLWVRTNIVFP
jgi:hypothetical protein